jgi:hypothetical protein
VIAQGALASEQYLFSSSPELNAIFGDAMRPASVRLREDDDDDDGRPELLHAEVSLPLRLGESVIGITVLTALRYSLQDTARYSTNATAIVHHLAGTPGSALQAWGELELRLSRVLPPISLGTTGPPVLAGASAQTTLSGLTPAALISRSARDRAARPPARTRELGPRRGSRSLQRRSHLAGSRVPSARRYMSYSDAVHLEPRYPVWISGGGVSRFTANVTMAVRPTIVRYQPGVAETLKFGWIQYISFFIPLWWILRQIKWFAAFYQITPCRVAVDRPGVRKISDHDF